jgi:hypothetical protein
MKDNIIDGRKPNEMVFVAKKNNSVFRVVVTKEQMQEAFGKAVRKYEPKV